MGRGGITAADDRPVPNPGELSLTAKAADTMLRSPVTGRAFVKLLALAFLAGLAAGAVHTLAQRAVGVFETRDGHASLRATENRPLPASRNALSALTRRRIAGPPRPRWCLGAYCGHGLPDQKPRRTPAVLPGVQERGECEHD